MSITKNKMIEGKKDIHEKYHRKTNSQCKIIGKNNFTYRFILSFLDKYLRRGMKILDIGCGAGTIDFYFANKGYEITGIDISDRAISSSIETAKKLGLKNVSFRVVDFPKDKVTGKFDFVIFSEVIEHLEDDKIALTEINKLLNPQGILFLSTPSINAPLHRLGLTKKFDKEVGHLRRYEKKQLLNILESAGFKVLEIKKNEGIIRNFLFVNPIAGKLVQFIKFYISNTVTFIDNLTIPIFGNSNWIVVARKK